eukprot:CAMPEP_0174370920 /NCGR_PEP_ID=MMETSP0811_2-20130205/97866_1 /TAXON_ID=73025 ORGANISM="Eutreptiella gymnastica-like, Strain CCMP1594" /NCGR_SAMPLE_ID=MMETSP0811_2 /ASSEMBLY_ACC=CAM_ASM_000667 /LENGTH=57 /DNA_ID=CAMNT_0015516821 /DNA_START=68 /DNA_END=242 /DNA_ORIENTATION=-
MGRAESSPMKVRPLQRLSTAKDLSEASGKGDVMVEVQHQAMEACPCGPCQRYSNAPN